MRHLREANAAKARETLCNSCREPVVNESNQLVVPFDGLPVTQCSNCGRNYCRKSSCEMGIRDCRVLHQDFLRPL